MSSSFLFAGPISEPFAGANNFSLIVAGDANLGSGVHVHGGGYIGGNLTVTGSNGGFGQNLAAGVPSLVVGGNMSSPSGNKQIALFNHSYYVGGTTGVTLQNPGTKLATNPLENSTTAIATALSNKAAELASQTATGATVNASDFNNIMISLTAGITNVLNLNSLNAAFLGNQNSNINFLNFTTGTKLIINYDMGGADFTFRAKNQGLLLAAFDDVIWNFTGGDKLTIANSVSTFKGSLVAANSLVDWKANDIDGQLIAGSLKWSNTSQSHYYTPWSAFELPKPVVTPELPVITPDQPVSTPEPGQLLLLASALTALALTRRKSLNK